MIIHAKRMCGMAIFLGVAMFMVSAMQNPVGTLDFQTRQRFTKLAPDLHDIDLFWSRLSQGDQLVLKEKRSLPGQTGRAVLSDDQFKQKAAALYLQVMPWSYRAYYYGQKSASYVKQQATNARIYWAQFWVGKPEQVGKVAVHAPQHPPMHAPKVKIPILKQAGKYREQPEPQEVEAIPLAVPESDVNPFEPPTPRQYVASIESQNIPVLHSQATIPCITSDKQVVQIPRSVVYLFPTLNDMVNVFEQKNMELRL